MRNRLERAAGPQSNALCMPCQAAPCYIVLYALALQRVGCRSGPRWPVCSGGWVGRSLRDLKPAEDRVAHKGPNGPHARKSVQSPCRSGQVLRPDRIEPDKLPSARPAANPSRSRPIAKSKRDLGLGRHPPFTDPTTRPGAASLGSRHGTLPTAPEADGARAVR